MLALGSHSGSVLKSDGDDGNFTFEAAETPKLLFSAEGTGAVDEPFKRHRYDVEATLSGGAILTLLRGAFVVTRTYTNEP